MRRTLCMAIMLQTSLASSQGIQGDVKYIRCGVCELLIGELHGHIERNPGLRKEEASILSALEDVQNPESSAGGWMRSIDLVERGDRLELERHTEDGPCGRECATIKLACAALLDEGWDNELSEALYSGTSLSQLRADACKEWSTACRKEPPKLDRNRAAGPPFRAFTDEDRAARDLRLGSRSSYTRPTRRPICSDHLRHSRRSLKTSPILPPLRSWTREKMHEVHSVSHVHERHGSPLHGSKL